MNSLAALLTRSPIHARVAPFLVFLALTFCQGRFGEASRYWFYLAKTLTAVWLIWVMRPRVAELRWNFSWPAVGVGIAVFLVWVGLDGCYPAIDQMLQEYVYPLLKKVGLASWCPAASKPSPPWNPHSFFGLDSALAWCFILVRIAGSTLVVPPLEEVFYRSFLYRYIAKPDFMSVPLGLFAWTPFLITSAIFGLAHYEWLPGILCGLAFQGLVCWKKRLGDAMLAHAITNLLLGLWVVSRGAWHFW